jgi:putative heme-binding domain-containing protein
MHRPLRDHAAQELTLKNEGRAYLIKQLTHPNARIRAASLQALVDDNDNDIDLDRIAQEDPDLELRGLAIRILGHNGQDTRRYLHDARFRGDAIASLRSEKHLPQLLEALIDADPFVRHAATQRFVVFPGLLKAMDVRRLADARQRLAFLLALRATGRAEAANLLNTFLADRDEDVRFLAAKWIADEKLLQHRTLVVEALKDPNLNVRMYRAYATALARLDGQEVNESKLADFFFARLIDEQTSPAVRVMALQLVPPRHPRLTLEFLRKLLAQPDPALQREAARTLAEHPSAGRTTLLLEAARNPKLDESVRTQALASLAEKSAEHVPDLLAFALKEKGGLRDEALRDLVDTPLSAEQRRQLEVLAQQQPDARDLVARVLGQSFTKGRPPARDVAAWLARLDGPADAAAGRRIFAQRRLANCASCHRAEGRGADVGPDLSTIGRTERRHLVESILQPSNSVAPHYQVWVIETADGRVRTGMLVHTNLDEYTYLDEKGGQFKVNTREVVSSRPTPNSIMPEGLADRLTDQEFRDLLAYLSSRR